MNECINSFFRHSIINWGSKSTYVESLGAKFIQVESDKDDGVGEGGYAKETSEDYKNRQQEKIKEHIAKSNLVITTALIPGRPAPS